ncbi:MAG: hypothetical protein QOI59_5379 [Gammaproteobacteria bacterium]|jgi:hypothetical protein|nr:hypothetical protein [Gammaproteobacteria bacterium]
MTRVLQTALLLACSTVTVAGTPQIPAELTVPAGEKLVLKAHATGSQIYTCKPGTDGALQWVLKAPDADLHDKKGAVIGHHFAGPSWKHKDGSEITGKASAHVDSPDAGSIPWLLVSVTGHTGEGMFAKVTSIQRINTKGGKPPAASECDASKTGTESKSAYSADYWFYAPGK